MVVAVGVRGKNYKAYGTSFERRILHGTSRRMPVLYYAVGNMKREKGNANDVTTLCDDVQIAWWRARKENGEADIISGHEEHRLWARVARHRGKVLKADIISLERCTVHHAG